MHGERPMLRFGMPGHESEYMLHIPGYGPDNYIPASIEEQLQDRLPDWTVMSRGTRIEILSRTEYGARHDAQVYPAVFAVVGLFDVLLPTIDVFDGDSGEIVNCAVVRELDDCWDVKPLSPVHFDEKDWIGGNTAFHMAHWRIGKTDMSAQRSGKLFFTERLHRLVLEKVLPHQAS